MQNAMNELRTALTAQLEAATQGKRLTDAEVEAAEKQCAVDYAQHLQTEYNLHATLVGHALFIEWVLYWQGYWGSVFVGRTAGVHNSKRCVVRAFLEWMQTEHAEAYNALDALTVLEWK